VLKYRGKLSSTSNKNFDSYNQVYTQLGLHIYKKLQISKNTTLKKQNSTIRTRSPTPTDTVTKGAKCSFQIDYKHKFACLKRNIDDVLFVNIKDRIESLDDLGLYDPHTDDK